MNVEGAVMAMIMTMAVPVYACALTVTGRVTQSAQVAAGRAQGGERQAQVDH
jgi:hypothetical protein